MAQKTLSATFPTAADAFDNTVLTSEWAFEANQRGPIYVTAESFLGHFEGLFIFACKPMQIE
jgi:hypothetical protein